MNHSRKMRKYWKLELQFVVLARFYWKLDFFFNIFINTGIQSFFYDWKLDFSRVCFSTQYWKLDYFFRGLTGTGLALVIFWEP